jgi:hypothetical protein
MCSCVELQSDRLHVAAISVANRREEKHRGSVQYVSGCREWRVCTNSMVRSACCYTEQLNNYTT